jgi:hypothetical protein
MFGCPLPGAILISASRYFCVAGNMLAELTDLGLDRNESGVPSPPAPLMTLVVVSSLVGVAVSTAGVASGVGEVSLPFERSREGSQGCGVLGEWYIRWRIWSITWTTMSVRVKVISMNVLSTGMGPSTLCLDGSTRDAEVTDERTFSSNRRGCAP